MLTFGGCASELSCSIWLADLFAYDGRQPCFRRDCAPIVEASTSTASGAATCGRPRQRRLRRREHRRRGHRRGGVFLGGGASGGLPAPPGSQGRQKYAAPT